MKNLAAAVVVFFSVCAIAGQPPPPGVRGGGMGMATRPVAKYGDLERKLMDSLQNRNEDVVRQLLVDDFEVRGDDATDPIPGNDWLRRQLVGSVKSFSVRDFSVREFGDVDIVSFLLDQQGTASGKPLPRTQFVVDVWRRDDGRLVTRYVSVPAHPLPPSNRPSGR